MLIMESFTPESFRVEAVLRLLLKPPLLQKFKNIPFCLCGNLILAYFCEVWWFDVSVSWALDCLFKFNVTCDVSYCHIFPISLKKKPFLWASSAPPSCPFRHLWILFRLWEFFLWKCFSLNIHIQEKNQFWSLRSLQFTSTMLCLCRPLTLDCNNCFGLRTLQCNELC